MSLPETPPEIGLLGGTPQDLIDLEARHPIAIFSEMIRDRTWQDQIMRQLNNLHIARVVMDESTMHFLGLYPVDSLNDAPTPPEADPTIVKVITDVLDASRNGALLAFDETTLQMIDDDPDYGQFKDQAYDSLATYNVPGIRRVATKHREMAMLRLQIFGRRVTGFTEIDKQAA